MEAMQNTSAEGQAVSEIQPSGGDSASDTAPSSHNEAGIGMLTRGSAKRAVSPQRTTNSNRRAKNASPGDSLASIAVASAGQSPKGNAPDGENKPPSSEPQVPTEGEVLESVSPAEKEEKKEENQKEPTTTSLTPDEDKHITAMETRKENHQPSSPIPVLQSPLDSGDKVSDSKQPKATQSPADSGSIVQEEEQAAASQLELQADSGGKVVDGKQATSVSPSIDPADHMLDVQKAVATSPAKTPRKSLRVRKPLTQPGMVNSDVIGENGYGSDEGPPKKASSDAHLSTKEKPPAKRRRRPSTNSNKTSEKSSPEPSLPRSRPRRRNSETSLSETATGPETKKTRQLRSRSAQEDAGLANAVGETTKSASKRRSQGPSQKGPPKRSKRGTPSAASTAKVESVGASSDTDQNESSLMQNTDEGEESSQGGQRPAARRLLGLEPPDVGRYVSDTPKRPSPVRPLGRTGGPEPQKDPNEEYVEELYVEELAWKYHNPPEPEPGATADPLPPLPPAPPISDFPSTSQCDWSFDEATRVLLAKFHRGKAIDKVDEEFLLKMMERDDLTVVMEGILDEFDWSPSRMEDLVGESFYHKFRWFERDLESTDPGRHKERDGCVSMRISDFLSYLEERQAALANKEESREFLFRDHTSQEHHLNVVNVVLYMIDYDFVKLLPSMNEDFMSSFKLPNILPGGKHCMMNSVNPSGRPFMGPNLYVTPPASFTHFHQDGHGTVDSGHLCIGGRNEVVMLRRLTERHKINALDILLGDRDETSLQPRDILYELPHKDKMGSKPGWPSIYAIEKCKTMNYYPSVFVLKPGQLVHINKGRLHAFRKLAPHSLPETDCHARLREALLTEQVDGKNDLSEEICFSIAWDWQFLGVTAEGINREVSATLECAALNRQNVRQSLAIPEIALLQMAKKYAPGGNKRSQIWRPSEKPTSFPTSKLAICRGILPSLRHVASKHIKAMEDGTAACSGSWEIGKRVSIARTPNTAEDPSRFPLDPYGSDFFCKVCHQELSNVYFHCDGCEKILSKDYNICIHCHELPDRKLIDFVSMHPLDKSRHSTINHLGKPKYDRQSRCPCKRGPACKNCSYCAGCSCRCHTWFTLHFRNMDKAEEKKLLSRVEQAVGEDEVLYSKETLERLDFISKEITR